MPVRHARSETRGRPPCGRRGEIGKNGTTRSHDGSRSNAAAMPVHATSPTRIKFWRFCYTLCGPFDTPAASILKNNLIDLCFLRLLCGKKSPFPPSPPFAHPRT